MAARLGDSSARPTTSRCELFWVQLAQGTPRQHETSHAERDVDPEDPVPRELAQDQAADDRTEDRPEQCRKADQGHHLPEVAWACGIDQEGLQDGSIRPPPMPAAPGRR